MHLRVFFTPAELIAAADAHLDDIYIVIDVIRATTTMAVMFEQGAKRVFVAEDIEQAQEAAQKYPERLLCGERNVRPLPGFDYGNSPVQFSQVDLSGRELILTTTNGTRAFYACPPHATRLAGSFYNARAVAAHALELASERQSNISLVCSGELGYFALDDATCAGYIAHEIIQLHQAYQREHAFRAGASSQAMPLSIYESVDAALALYEAFRPPKIMDHCDSARSVINAGLIEDVYFCMQQSKSIAIPIVIGQEEDTGLWIVEKV